MITNKMRSKLSKDLGYLDDEVNKLIVYYTFILVLPNNSCVIVTDRRHGTAGNFTALAS